MAEIARGGRATHQREVESAQTNMGMGEVVVGRGGWGGGGDPRETCHIHPATSCLYHLTLPHTVEDFFFFFRILKFAAALLAFQLAKNR
jgi:hypothetical protein